MHGHGCVAPAQLLNSTPHQKPQAESHTVLSAEMKLLGRKKRRLAFLWNKQPCSASPFPHQETRFCDLMKKVASKSQESMERFAQQRR